MIVGCYTMHLYCDAPGCQHGKFKLQPMSCEYTAETGSECRQQARKDGWKLNLDTQSATCRRCASKAPE